MDENYYYLFQEFGIIQVESDSFDRLDRLKLYLF